MLSKDIVATLSAVTTATLTTVLFKHGLRNVWLRGTAPLVLGQPRVVGEAFTMRFVPAREDLATPAVWSSPTSSRVAVETMPEGCIAVVDAMGVTDAGILGDIMCARMRQRGVAGLVTDGVVRDRAGVVASELGVWSAGAAAPPAVSQMVFAGWGDMIGCGGVTVIPGDVIVADDDGAIVIPAGLVQAVAAEALDMERQEEWIVAQIRQGSPLGGLYPMDAQTKARYDADSAAS